jgi:hypothetical protein
MFITQKYKQIQIAIEVYGDQKYQGQVSRNIEEVRTWIKAGNVLPDLDLGGTRPKVTPIDPRQLDLGPRNDRGRIDPKRSSEGGA